MRVFVGLVGILFWIAAATGLAVFVMSYSMVDGRIGVEVLQWTIWPYVILVAAGMISISLLAAGPAAIGQLVKLRSSLDKIPDHLTDLQALQKGSIAITSQMKEALAQVQKATEAARRAADDAAAAAAKTDEASYQIADANVAADKKPLADQLSIHYELAKQQYWKAAEEYKNETGRDIERTRGYLNAEVIDDFSAHQVIPPVLSRYMKRVLQVEANTRRTSRRDLTQATINELDSLREQAAV